MPLDDAVKVVAPFNTTPLPEPVDVPETPTVPVVLEIVVAALTYTPELLPLVPLTAIEPAELNVLAEPT